jgi:hypothetical protein
MYLFPQAPNLFLRESINGSQVEARRGFAPTGSPKYLKGIEDTLQLRNTDATLINSSDTLTPIK